jgi:hypothetical protein
MNANRMTMLYAICSSLLLLSLRDTQPSPKAESQATLKAGRAQQPAHGLRRLP